MQFEREAYFGDVTALESVRLGDEMADYCFAGMGPTLLIYDLKLGTSSVHLVFSGARIHGIRIQKVHSRSCILMIFGDRYLQLFSVETSSDPGLNLQEQSERIGLSHWILDGVFHSANYILIGLSNNSIQLLSRTQDSGNENSGMLRKLMLFNCSLQTFLFSMSIHLRQDPESGSSVEVHVASGTAFNDVFVWKFNLDLQRVEPVDPIWHLIGHTGGVLRLKWSSDCSTLLSASEDRTFALWKILEETHDFEVAPQFRSFGHKARIWDLLQCKDSIITCSEDCTFRIWSSNNGQLLSTYKGQVGKGIWRCVLAPDLSLITAGADGGILVWSGIFTSASSNHIKETEIEVASSINDLKFSRSWLGQIYICSENNGVLIWQQSIHCSPKEVSQELYKDTSNAGSFLCCSTSTVQVANDQLYDLVVLGHSKGSIVILLVNENGKMIENLTLKEPTGKPVLSIVSQTLGSNLEFLISSGDCSGSMVCHTLVLTPHLVSYLPQEAMLSFRLESPLKTRLICIEHFILDGRHFIIAGDTHGSVIAWYIQQQDFTSLQICGIFKSIHGKQPIGMIRFDPQRRVIYTAARNFSLQEYQLGNGKIQSGSVLRLQHISTAEYLEFGESRVLIGGYCNREFCFLDWTRNQLLMKIDAGGRNRTHDLTLFESSLFFAYVEKQKIHVFTCPVLGASSKEGFHRQLHLSLHGDEINDIKIIPLGQQGQILVLTASEDAQLKSSFFSTLTKQFYSSKDVGIAAAGTSIKALAILKIEQSNSSINQDSTESYLCVTVGSKQVIMTWKIEVLEGKLESTLLSVKPPDRGGLRPSSTHDQTLLKSDLRFLTMTLLPSKDSLQFSPLYMIVSSSDASLTVYCFNHESREWTLEASLDYHKSPVISLDHIKVETPFGIEEILVVSGSTDGTLCLWKTSCNLDFTLVSQPIAVHESLHQSGINSVCLSQSSCNQSRILMVSGGDDQSIAVVGIQWEEPEWTIILLQSISNAHSSSVRDVVLHEGLVFSIGLDQRLIRWRIDKDDQLIEEEVVLCEVPYPSSMDIVTIEDTHLAVAGSGIQLLKCV